MIEYGDKSQEVTEIQKLLSLLGYDLIIDGSFGDKTLRSLKAFQKRMALPVDGLAGPRTIEALKASQKRTAKEEKSSPTPKVCETLSINRKHQLSSTQYIKQSTSKDKIFIHFTASGPSAPNVISYWDKDEPRVSTSYVIDGENGEVFECFSPDFWSFHLGVKGTNGAIDKSSIGIEICMWGPITKKEDKFFNYINMEISADEVCELDKPFRGFKYFHKISDAQLSSLETLLDFLITEYNIPVQTNFDLNWFEFNQELINKKMPGLWTHTNVRKDKSDMYPDNRFIDMLNRLAKKHNK